MFLLDTVLPPALDGVEPIVGSLNIRGFTIASISKDHLRSRALDRESVSV